MAEYRKESTFEKPVITMNGIAMLLLLIAAIAAAGVLAVVLRNPRLALGFGIAAAFIAPGFFMLQPNEACVLTLFGRYLGTEREPGLRWTLPWNIRKRVSVRARNQSIETLKVNDKRGNPVEIGAVIIWRVEDTAKARFEVDDVDLYVKLQSAVVMVEAALTALSERNVVTPDDERRAAMVSTLLVVLCGDKDTQPIINAGTLYS